MTSAWLQTLVAESLVHGITETLNSSFVTCQTRHIIISQMIFPHEAAVVSVREV